MRDIFKDFGEIRMEKFRNLCMGIKFVFIFNTFKLNNMIKNTFW